MSGIQILAFLYLTTLILSFIRSTKCELPEGETCGSDELNHSVLIECNSTNCGPPEFGPAILRPRSTDEILHVYSTRDGDRFMQASLSRTAYEKLFSFKTTFSIDIKSKPAKSNKILGFGATLDVVKHAANIEKAYGLVLDDLFGELPSGASLSFLRLPLDMNAPTTNLSKALQDIDQHVAESRNYDPDKSALKIILDMSGRSSFAPESSSLVETIGEISRATDKLSSIEIWAIALEHTFLSSIEVKNQDYYAYIRKSQPNALILAAVDMVDAPKFVDQSTTNGNFQGLIIRGQSSIPYNIIDYLASKKPPPAVILTVGAARPKTRDYGDWNNAQNRAVELLRHIGHGSQGYIESLSVNDILNSGDVNQDTSLYNLHTSHQLHFKGPMFYGLAHFSRYLPPGSELLDFEIATQPNMFSAHYSAFRTPDNHVVALVLNSNEHLVPIRFELDNKIIGSTLIPVNSFNTFVIKL